MENLRYAVKIAIDKKPQKVRKITNEIEEFEKRFRDYKKNSDDESPYYSGHEFSDNREKILNYKFTKNIQDLMTILMRIEQRELPFPTKEFPLGIEDINVTLSLELKYLDDKNLRGLFERLKEICDTKMR